MALSFPPPPEWCDSTLAGGMQRILGENLYPSPLPSEPGLESIAPFPELEGVGPFPLYEPDPGAVEKTGFPEGAEQAGWRYVVLADEKPAGVGTVRADGVFSRYQYGGFAASALRAIQLAEEQVKDAPETFEVRWLEIRLLCFSALWIRPESGAGGWLCPLDPIPEAGIEACLPVTPEVISAVLLKRLQQGGGVPEPQASR